MAVAADGTGSTVTLATDFTVVGRVAQFGRGIMEDVSRHLVGQAAECIQSKLEAPPPSAAPVLMDGVRSGSNGVIPPPRPPPAPPAPSQPAALDAVALGGPWPRSASAASRSGPQTIAIGFGGLVSLLLLRRVRRARRRRRETNG